jgi:hypothetical protein
VRRDLLLIAQVFCGSVAGVRKRAGPRDLRAAKPRSVQRGASKRRHAGTIVVALKMAPPMLSTMTTMSQSGRL